MKHYKEHYAPVDDLYKEATDLILKGENLNYAGDIINTLLIQDPDSPVLIFQLANIAMKKKFYPEAEVHYLRCIQLKPDFPEAYMNLGCIYKDMQRRDDSRKAFETYISMCESLDKTNEEKAVAYLNYGSSFTANGTPLEGLEIFEKGIALDPTNTELYWNRGLAYLELGDYEKGFCDYENGVRVKETKDRRYTGDKPTLFWDGTPGQTVVVFGEQGIGDELMFASMIPDLMKDCNVILDMHPRLANLFRYSYPNIPIYGTRKVAETPWSQFHTIDAKVSIATLGKFYRKTKEDFPGTPYLEVPIQLKDKYRLRLDAMGGNKKVGISWKGGSATTNSNDRKIKLKQLIPVLETEGVDFISLQYHEDSAIHIKNLHDQTGMTIHHWQDVLDDYDETAGLVSNLDYIISVPQSVVHLAGAIGTPTLQLCPKKALWQMGPYGQNMPWYSCVENAWQDDTCTWEPVITQAKEKLCSLLQTSTSN